MIEATTQGALCPYLCQGAALPSLCRASERVFPVWVAKLSTGVRALLCRRGIICLRQLLQGVKTDEPPLPYFAGGDASRLTEKADGRHGGV